jgi:hypothetical protein
MWGSDFMSDGAGTVSGGKKATELFIECLEEAGCD